LFNVEKRSTCARMSSLIGWFGAISIEKHAY
jgi:hypothetical protein